MSYNSTGSNDHQMRYLNDASYGYDIILVQEHWLLSNNLKRIKTAVQGFTGIANSCVDEDKCVLEGRPYGGCTILWRTGLTKLIKPILVESLSIRICSIILTLNDYKLIATSEINAADIFRSMKGIKDIVNSR